MLRLSITGSLLVALLFLGSAQSAAQTPAPSSSSSCPCTLRGSVLDSVTGQPVNRALVRLSGSSHATLTDAEGKFQFEGLPESSFTVETVKPGFLGMEFGIAKHPSTVSIRLVPDTSPLVLKLTPESVIFGQVTDENGEPLEGFSVPVFIRNSADGRYYPDQRSHYITDDEGKFRIAGLHPGSYVLAASQIQGPAMNSSRKAAVPVGYSILYYPAGHDLSSAVPIKLPPGKVVQANFSLARAPYVRLSGTVTGANPQEQVSMSIEDSSGSSESSTHLQVSFDPATSSFQTKWIPPGTYTLIARAMNPAGENQGEALSFASLHVNAASSHSDLHLILQPTVKISVVIHGLPDPGPEQLQSLPLGIGLFSARDNPQSLTFAPSPESPAGDTTPGDVHLLFPGVVPGAYELTIASPPDSSLYAESVTWGSTDLLHSDLVLDSSGAVPPIEISVRSDGATLNGIVSSGDIPRPALVVLLSDARRKPQLVGVRNDGRFEASGLAPGAYRVFAVDTSTGLDYSDPAFVQKISGKVQEVTLSAKQSTSVELEVATGDE